MGDIFDDAEAAFAEPAAKPAPAQPESTRARARGPDPDAAAKEAAFAEQADRIEDGIYFGLPMEVYRKVRRLGSGSLTDMLVSPANFWEDSWLNPDRKERSTEARLLGSAYHCARLEPEAFESRYCRKIDKADFAEAVEAWGGCFNGTEIGMQLAVYGEAKKKAGESVLEQAQRLEQAGYKGLIWPIEEARWQAALGEREAIPAEHWDAILTDMERIHQNPDISPLLSGGFAEVSIFWTDRNGLKCKARLDYLRPESWADFKTFENRNRKVLRQALVDALQYNRYHVQASHYRDAVEAVRVGNIPLRGEASAAQQRLVAELQMRPGELTCWYIFQEKGGVPNLMAMKFPFHAVPIGTTVNNAGASDEQIAAAERATRRPTGLFIRAQQDVERAKQQFMLYSEVYIPGQPWAPLEPLGEFEDLDFNTKWLEGYYG